MKDSKNNKVFITYKFNDDSPSEVKSSNEEGKWLVDQDGTMLYITEEGEVIYEIGPELLSNPERLYELSLQPDLNVYSFYVAFLRANDKVGSARLDLVLSKG